MTRQWIGAAIAAAIVWQPVAAAAEIYSYRHSNGRNYINYTRSIIDRGGALGVTLGESALVKDGNYCIPVVSVRADSRFSLNRGDCIYAVGDVHVTQWQDVANFSRAFAPGTPVRIYYYSAANGWLSYWQEGRLVAAQREQYSAPPPRAYSPPPPPTYSTPSLSSATAALNSRIDDFLRADSVGWANKYVRGTVRNARIVSSYRDSYVVRANYSYGSGANDWVEMTVRNNQLACLSYGTEFSRCRQPYRAGGTSASTWVAAGVVTAVIAVAAASRSGGGSRQSSGSYSGQGSGSSYPPDDDRPKPQTPAPESRDRTEPPRTYGLYGNCPQPGAGYGC